MYSFRKKKWLMTARSWFLYPLHVSTHCMLGVRETNITLPLSWDICSLLTLRDRYNIQLEPQNIWKNFLCFFLLVSRIKLWNFQFCLVINISFILWWHHMEYESSEVHLGAMLFSDWHAMQTLRTVMAVYLFLFTEFYGFGNLWKWNPHT